MANKKYKLTDGNYWATDGVYDFDQGKTQREVNSDLSGAINDEIAERKTYTKPNLLDNWYFIGGGSQAGAGKFPINQRGQTSYTGAVYTIDRWKLNGASHSLSIQNGQFKLTQNSTLLQTVENSRTILPGKPVTYSILTSDGLASQTIIVPDTSGTGTAWASISGVHAFLWIDASSVSFAIFNESNSDGNILAAKLEIGYNQTLAHQVNGAWVLNELPNYQEELVKCIGSHADSSDTYANNDYANVPRIYHKSGLMPTAIGGANQTVYAASVLGITVPSGKTFVLLDAEALNANTNSYYHISTVVGVGDVCGGVLVTTQPNVVFRCMTNDALTAYGGQPVNFIVAVL